jgi:hypothetical protein
MPPLVCDMCKKERDLLNLTTVSIGRTDRLVCGVCLSALSETWRLAGESDDSGE